MDEDQIEKNMKEKEKIKGKIKKKDKKKRKEKGRKKSKKKKNEFRWDKIRPKEKRNKRGKGGKPRKERGGEKIGQRGSKWREIERGEKKMEIFPAFRRSELDDQKRKVNPRIVSYAWVPKSWSFIKLHEVENFPTPIIFSLKVI